MLFLFSMVFLFYLLKHNFSLQVVYLNEKTSSNAIFNPKVLHTTGTGSTGTFVGCQTVCNARNRLNVRSINTTRPYDFLIYILHSLHRSPECFSILFFFKWQHHHPPANLPKYDVHQRWKKVIIRVCYARMCPSFIYVSWYHEMVTNDVHHSTKI